MSSNNPKHKPLHRIRHIRNARRSAEQFPQLADYLFDPSHARATVYDPQDPKWRGTGGWDAVAPPTVPPQPTMQQFYTAPAPRAASLRPLPFATAADRAAHMEQWATAGFVPFVKNGNNQFERMMRLGLDPRMPPSAEEVRRRAENEARVQVFRDSMTLDTIVENSGGGKWRKEGSFLGWSECLAKQKTVHALADKQSKGKDQGKAQG